MQYVPRYLTGGDFRKMSATAKDGKSVRWGEIDYKRLLEAISGLVEDDENVKASREIMEQSIKRLPKFQYDLLKMEFGSFETKLGSIKPKPDSNITDVYSLETNQKMLRQTLEYIEAELQPGRRTAKPPTKNAKPPMKKSA